MAIFDHFGLYFFGQPDISVKNVKIAKTKKTPLGIGFKKASFFLQSDPYSGFFTNLTRLGASFKK